MVGNIDLAKPEIINLLNDPHFQEAVRSLSDHTLDWANLMVLASTAAIAAVTAWFISKQIRDGRIEAQAERTRLSREFAVQLLNRWTDQQNPETISIVRLVRRLSKEECLILADRELKPLYLQATMQIKELVEDVLSRYTIEFDISSLTTTENKLEISGKYLAHIKYHIISYLNLLESVLAAWRLSVADREIIETQFGFLRTAEDSNLKVFRDALTVRRNGDQMPSLSEFVASMPSKTVLGSGLNDR